MSLNFEKNAAKGNEFLNHLTIELGIPNDRARAGRILRSVLKALRNRLTVEESMQMIAQLPMAIKAVYIDGWKLSKKQERMKTLDDFMIGVLEEDKLAAINDFSSEEQTKAAIEAVFKTLSRYVSEGEFMDIIAVVPKELKIFFAESIQS